MSRGFTLIESLAVIAIIGILASLTIFTFSQAQSRGRDAKRKNDLTAIALAFQARYEAQTCSNLSDRGFYPGRSLVGGDQLGGTWTKVTDLRSVLDDCGAFSEYMVTIPEDPIYMAASPYIFDLSTKPPPGVVGKHYRLGARLERVISSQESSELARMSELWEQSFGGKSFPTGSDYSYFIGK